MGLGIPIALGQATLSTTESSNLVDPTYLYIGPGKVRIFAKGSDATTRINFFINGQKICRLLRPQYGTAGTLDTSANPVAEFNTAGGVVEFTAIATAATPTLDYAVYHEGLPFISAVLNKVGNLLR